MTPNDVKIVADNIDDFIEVPNGTEKLRQAVLTLAVSGKIVPQIKSEKITEEIKASTNIETPFDIPKSWKWVNLEEICDIQTGKKDANQGHDNGKYNFYTCARIPIRSNTYSFEGPSLILPGNGANVGYVFYVNEKFEAYQRTYVLNNFVKVDAKYISIVFDALWRDRMGKQYGGAINFIKIGNLTKFILPIPPLSEQKRIVQKVEELIKQLDELEIKKRERDEVRARLARSAMQSLGKGESKIAFEQLSELIKTPADLKELEGALLTLAMSGQLVKQNKKDGVARELSQQKENGGRKKKAKVFSEITPEDAPFEIPENWKWVRFGSVFTDYSSGSTPSRGNDGFYKDGNTNWYKSGELNDGVLSSDSEEKITNLALEKCHLRMNKRGDLLIAMYGATAGRVAMFDNEGTTNQAVWGGTPDDSVDLKYLFFYILHSRHQLLKTSSGAAQPNISGEKISSHPLALPPLAEQRRIVKKVEEVMSLVNNLKPLVAIEK